MTRQAGVDAAISQVNVMNQITIRNLDDETAQKLKKLAWQDGRPPEEMARRLLIETVNARAERRSLAELPFEH